MKTILNRDLGAVYEIVSVLHRPALE